MIEDTHYRVLKILEQNPYISQRELASELRVSLGKVNYCLKALIEKGWVKMDNFTHNPHKLHYAYLLTPRGLKAKTALTARFLKRKLEEYEALKSEIEQLQGEAGSLAGD
jgi:EPS-associated MarR family transcriptional regulator